MTTTTAKWNTQPEHMKVWQVAREIGRFRNDVSVKLMSAGVEPPALDGTIAMENPIKPGTVGHLFVVIDVRPEEGNYWIVGLRLIPHPGFDTLPPHVTPLAYHEPINTKQDA